MIRSAPCWAALAAAAFLLPPASAQDDASQAETLRAELAHLRSRMILETVPELEWDPTTLLVRFHPWQLEAERASLREWVGAGRIRSYDGLPGLELIAVSGDVEAAIEALEPYVQYAEPNYVQRVDQTVPNDTYFSLQWGIHNTGQTIQGDVGVADADIDGVEAWDLSTGDANFLVAIIDTGTQWSHPDLAANIWTNPGEIAGNGQDDDGNGYVDDTRGWDFYSGDNNPDDTDGHGTHTAGTVGAVGNNGVGVAGVNWQCKLVPLRFLGPQGGFTSDAISAVQYCTTNNIKVSNNSWGGGGFSQGLYDAIDASKSIGHVFLAAAGNDGVNTDSIAHYPSSYNVANIVSVAATDNRDGLADEPTWGSNYGATTVDLGAPGVNIASTYSGSSYVWSSGTSMATPHVAGVAALVYADDPSLGWSGVVNRLLSTVRANPALAGKCTTGGVLDAFAALDTGGGGDTTPPANPSGLGATGGDGTVALDWSDNGESDLAGYRVYRSTTSGGGYAEISSGLVGTSDYTDNGVTNGTTYYYVVRAEDTSGNLSGNSNEASATPSGGGGGPVTLFADGFESGNLSSGGWSTSGNVSAHTKADRTGVYGARLKRSSSITRAVDTSGFATVELSYSRRSRNMDSGEYLHVEWSADGGSSWTVAEFVNSTSWADPTVTLPVGAGDNPNFVIRFRTNANRNNERGDVDDVEVIGTTL